MAHAARVSGSASDAARTGAPAVFRLAPMTRDLTVMTWIACVLPFWLVGAASLSSGPAKPVLVVAVWFTMLIYVCVWVYGRPTRFEIDDQVLRIVWPIRRREIPRHLVRDARILTGAEFRNA